jgi:hypothetical protein
MLLLAPSSRAAILERCRATVRHVELAGDSLFEQTFVECLQLAETRLGDCDGLRM